MAVAPLYIRYVESIKKELNSHCLMVETLKKSTLSYLSIGEIKEVKCPDSILFSVNIHFCFLICDLFFLHRLIRSIKKIPLFF